MKTLPQRGIGMVILRSFFVILILCLATSGQTAESTTSPAEEAGSAEKSIGQTESALKN